MNSNPFTVFLLGMLAFFILKPLQFYNDKGSLKTWHHINLDKPDTLYNIYVYAVVLAVIAHYLTKTN